jgi:membrane fusion protein (multidrug efflux system)
MKRIFSILLVVLTACGGSQKTDPKTALADLKKQEAEIKGKILKLEEELAKTDSTTKAKFVSVTQMTIQPFNHYVEIQGKVDGDEDVNLSPEMPGNVMTVNVHPGDHVTKGQVLATIDDRTLRQNLDAMKAQHEMATIMYNKQKNLWDQKIGSEVQYIQAKTQKDAMDKQYAALEQQWEMTRIKSPINGTIDQVNIKVGQAAVPGIGVIRVVNLSKLKVKGEVAESYISKVKKGADVVIYFPDTKKEVKSKLNYSGQVINSLNRTFNVEVELDEKSGDYHPNQIAILKIADYSSPKTFVVPVGAVQKSSDGEFVYVTQLEGGKEVVKRKIVSSGLTYNGQAEIKKGLAEGDKVITTGFQNVIEGDIVKL